MLSCAVLLILATSSHAALFTEDASFQKNLWESFKNEYGKSYETTEIENRKFSIFLENLKTVDLRNELEQKNGGSAVHGITKFSDLSQDEFAAHYLTADEKLKSAAADREYVTIDRQPDMSSGLVDWSGKLTTPVKDQGYCGSCWAFSATEQIESDAIRTLGLTYLLSPEQITQCDKTSSGCNGGWSEHAYNYVKSAGGLETEANYPYTSYKGVTGTCSAVSSKFVVTVTGYKTLSGESAMASYVQTTGPLSVCLDASSWNSYTGCATGVDATSSSPYWKVRNSWGTSWGESGYIRLKYGANTCDITNDPTYATVAKK
eukprot:gene22598-30866_t